MTVENSAPKQQPRDHLSGTAGRHGSDPVPRPGPEDYWLRALAEGRLLLQRSRSSGKAVFPPRVMEPGSGTRDLEWFEARKSGTVYACTVVYPPAAESAYSVVLVDLDEGVRMMGRIEGMSPEHVQIGLKVNAEIVSQDGNGLVAFRAV